MGGVWCNIAGLQSKIQVDGIQLRRFFKSSVGNGLNTVFWLDPWIINEPLKDRFLKQWNFSNLSWIRNVGWLIGLSTWITVGFWSGSGADPYQQVKRLMSYWIYAACYTILS
ncbi:putative aminoglycoside 6'-N-acetyltransferase [Helianthus annuus]|uniref:Aminoglycoside 6'-N-acetyltransferase n=1 Tax=Helianthus annuus TaxID=4232 RepID=A0A9K3E998_HELAN|nr:putative aminoglycoside 6'-N-acetyltransferase [Helianthus annuus]